MVDCFDRITVQLTEIALESVRQLTERSMLNSISLRVSNSGRKFTITIAKRFVGAKLETQYVWRIDEIDLSGELLVDGAWSALPVDNAFSDPETAYWSAIDGLCAITRKV